MKKRLRSALAGILIMLLILPMTALAADLMDKDADPPEVVSSGSFDSTSGTRMDFSESGGNLTGAEWTYVRHAAIYKLLGTCKEGETISLSITGTQAPGVDKALVGNNISAYLTFRDGNANVIDEEQRYESGYVKSSPLSYEIGAAVPSGAKTVDINITFSCCWAGAEIVTESVTVMVKLDVVEDEPMAALPAEPEPEPYSAPDPVSEPEATPFVIPEFECEDCEEEAGAATVKGDDEPWDGSDPWVHAGPVASIIISIIAALAAIFGGGAGGAAGVVGAAAGGAGFTPEPQSMVINTTNGAQILVVRDPVTGEWINSETGNPIDISRHEEFVKQQEQTLEQQRARNAELEQTGQTAMQQGFDEIARREKEGFDAIQREIDARRREQLERDQTSLEWEAAHARSTAGWGRIISDGLIGTAKDTGEALKNVTIDPVVWAGETLGTAAGTLVYDPQRVAETAKQAIEGAWDEMARTARDIKNDPLILVKTWATTSMDVYQMAKGVAKTAADTVTDPKKTWEFIKREGGMDNYAKSLDPNLPVIQRIGQSIIGTFKLGTVIFTAAKGLEALKSGVSNLSGIADDVLGAGGKSVSGAAGEAGISGAKKAAKLAMVEKPGDAAAIKAFRAAQKEGQDKVDDFIAALKSRDPKRINAAALNVQSDNQAIANINNRSNFVKNQFNKFIKDNYDEVDKRVIERLAGEKGVNPKDIKVVSATNPNKSLKNIKVGDDRDITVRIKGKDVKADELQKIYNEEFKKVTGADAGQLRQTAVDRTSPDAYGSRPGDLKKALSGRGDEIADSEQMGKTISHKAHEAAAKADKAAEAGDLMQSQREMFDGMRQTTKQWHNQVESAIKNVNKTPGKLGKVTVHPRLEKAINIMDQINEGVSPMEIAQQLRSIDMTPDDVFTQSGEFFDSMLRLR